MRLFDVFVELRFEKTQGGGEIVLPKPHRSAKASTLSTRRHTVEVTISNAFMIG